MNRCIWLLAFEASSRVGLGRSGGDHGDRDVSAIHCVGIPSGGRLFSMWLFRRRFLDRGSLLNGDVHISNFQLQLFTHFFPIISHFCISSYWLVGKKKFNCLWTSKKKPKKQNRSFLFSDKDNIICMKIHMFEFRMKYFL